MNTYMKPAHRVTVFKHFSRKGYAIMSSLRREVRIGVLAACTLATAQHKAYSAACDTVRIPTAMPEDRDLDEASVTGQRVPVTLMEAATKVDVITRDEIQRAHARSVNDLLKLCLGMDVRQRGPYGVQTDISLGGGTFDQTALLLNGVSLNNPQTGHHSAHLPVSPDDIERIEVYDGAAARVFGSQALYGAINIVTRSSARREGTVHAEAGSFGTVGAGGSYAFGNAAHGQRLSLDLARSDGGTEASSFRHLRAYWNGHYSDDQLRLSWQAGVSRKDYDANTFYSALYPNQWESEQRYLASLSARTRGRVKLEPRLSWIRYYDHFQLTRRQSAGENFHRGDVLTASLGGWTQWALGRTALNAEIRTEDILSTSLGRPLDPVQYVRVEGKQTVHYTHSDQRTNLGASLEHLLSWRRLDATLGLLANRNSAIDQSFRLYPGIDARWRPHADWAIYASWSESMRLPTFTDLYYKSPTLQGNIGLQPERALTAKLGVDYARGPARAGLAAIRRHSDNIIDWVMRSPDDLYHATSFRLTGYEVQAKFAYDFRTRFGDGCPVGTLSLGYQWVHQDRRDDQTVWRSNYAMNYLRHKFQLGLDHRLYGRLSANWTLRWADREGTYVAYPDGGQPETRAYHPYALLTLALQWQGERATWFATFENLTNHAYYDLGNIPQPGLWMMAGVKIKL